MKVNGHDYRTIWRDATHPACIRILDQRRLPHELVVEDLRSVSDVASAISDMHLRGAIVIGVAAAYGMYLAALEAMTGKDFHASLNASAEILKRTRPTAANLAWAVDIQLTEARLHADPRSAVEALARRADAIAEDEVERSRAIGRHGLEIIRALARGKGRPVQILTHCNAGWLACVELGTATAPIYAAHLEGIDLHVWVDETRPRNQGALTAWELMGQGVPCTYIPDNAGALFMQRGEIDMVIVGADRVSRRGDVANKIGTYLKALAAREHSVPFYVALPSSTIDWTIEDGESQIVIEERSADEVDYVTGLDRGETRTVRVTPVGTRSLNPAFDVTPARFVTGLITERGFCRAEEDDIRRLFPEENV